MIVIKENRNDNLLNYTFKNDKKSYNAHFKICKSPVCTCCNIDLLFYSRDDQLLDSKIETSINLFERRVSGSIKDEGTNIQFTNLLIDDFDENDWKILTELYLERKIQFTENSDIKSMDLNFPIEEIETESTLVSYYQILPFSQLLSFKIDNNYYIVEDLYCVNPDCDCSDIHLLVCPYNDKTLLLPFHQEREDEFHIIYNIKSKKWDVEEENKESDYLVEEIMSNFVISYNIQSIYSARYKRIRSLYKNFRHRLLQETLSSERINIGRNDPCPCGSGKKYKKSCMIKGT